MLVAFVPLLVAALRGQMCGAPCEVDTTCAGDTECFQCIKTTNVTAPGVCGDGCGMNCTENSHCANTACQLCEGGVCSKAPTPPPGNLTCGGVCTNDDECSPGLCAQCVITLGNNTGHCGAGCGMNCTNSTQCQNAACPVCDPYVSTCQPGPTPPHPPSPPDPTSCKRQCVVDTQCAGECFQCIINQGASIGECGDGCGMNCTDNRHCLATACPVCNVTKGVCESHVGPPPSPTPGHGACRDPCTNDDQCDATSKCDKCVVLRGSGVCGVACGEFCSEDSQCVDEMCSVCDHESGTCEAPVPPPPDARCLQACVVNTDCIGLCSLCMAGHCKQGCGFPCLVNADCGAPGCTICSLSTKTCVTP